MAESDGSFDGGSPAVMTVQWGDEDRVAGSSEIKGECGTRTEINAWVKHIDGKTSQMPSKGCLSGNSVSRSK